MLNTRTNSTFSICKMEHEGLVPGQVGLEHQREHLLAECLQQYATAQQLFVTQQTLPLIAIRIIEPFYVSYFTIIVIIHLSLKRLGVIPRNRFIAVINSSCTYIIQHTFLVKYLE